MPRPITPPIPSHATPVNAWPLLLALALAGCGGEGLAHPDGGPTGSDAGESDSALASAGRHNAVGGEADGAIDTGVDPARPEAGLDAMGASPEAGPDLQRDSLVPLPPDAAPPPPELLPPDEMVVVPPDVAPDLTPDLAPDLLAPDLAPDLVPDRGPDLGPDLAP